jgi:hypothetical protein
VVKTDGSAVSCDKLSLFDHLKNGPCIFGDNGSVALYVTVLRQTVDGNWENTLPYNEHWGIKMTYIAKDEIGEIRVNQPATFSNAALEELRALSQEQSASH